jgi:pyrroloquinoline-quinone synthase
MDLLDRIDAMIEERNLLTHPFYTKWAEGTLPIEALREYTRQYYTFESTFPRLLSALHSRSDRPEVRSSILENLWDEEHGDANHRELWLRFGEGVGADREGVVSAEPNEATSALMDAYWKACTEGSVASGVAAVYAYERQVPPVAQAKIDGLKKWFGIEDDRTLGFFQVHATLDVEHSAAERQIISGASAEDESAILDATADALDAWWAFLDAVDPKVEALV